MAYITPADLSARLGGPLYARLTDRTNGTSPDAVVAQQIVDEAEAEADSRLARRYATPVDLAAHPELAALLEQRVLDLAEYLAWRGSPFISDLPGRVKQLYQDAREWFERVADGRALLPARGVLADPPVSSDTPLYSPAARPFTGEALDGL